MGAVSCRPQPGVCACWESLDGPGEAAFDHTGDCPDAEHEPHIYTAEENDAALAPAPPRLSHSQTQRSTNSLGVASLAKVRLRGAVAVIKATNRFRKSVRFDQESVAEVVTFEVNSSGSDPYNGLSIGDKVMWTDRDEDVPKGSVGEVQGFGEKDIVQVRFPKGTWDFKASELYHQESWAANLVRTSLTKAEMLMRELRVLEAESTLAEALEKLQDIINAEAEQEAASRGHSQGSETSTNNSGKGGMRTPGQRRASLLSASECAEAAAAIKRLRQAVVYRDVVQRCGQYDAFGRALLPDGFRLCYEGQGSQLWVRTDPGHGSWYEYKLVCDLGDAGLEHCLAYSHELDLRYKYEPRLLEKPHYLGPVNPLLCVTHSLMRVLALRVEIILEYFRWFNLEYGFYGESVRSNFPEKGRHLPERAWRNCRVSLFSQNLWIPKGNGEPGTVAVILTRVNAGGRLGRWMLSSLIKQVATTQGKALRGHVARVRDPSSPYHERLRQDKLGFYRELAKVEAAAAKRTSPPISVANLPSAEILRRAKPLPADWP